MLAAAAALACAASASNAADQEGNYALRGIGSASCTDYNAALSGDAAQAQVFVSWMAGYITARSRTADDTFDVLPLVSGADVAGLMRVICVQNEASTFEGALDAAIRLFEPARVRSDSPLLELAHEGNRVAIRQATLVQVQQALAAAGLYTAAVDGAYGPGTRSAISEFQRQNELPITGLPDADTLVALLL